MRQVILQEFVSLDGLAAGPNASVDVVPAATRDDRSFEQHQLQYQLVICPLVLGSGTPLFGDQAPKLELKLQEARPFDRGEVALKYIRTGR